MLEPDVAKAFADSAAVNDVLKSLLDLTKTTHCLTKNPADRAYLLIDFGKGCSPGR